jgi:hypothetical protein
VVELIKASTLEAHPLSEIAMTWENVPSSQRPKISMNSTQQDQGLSEHKWFEHKTNSIAILLNHHRPELVPLMVSSICNLCLLYAWTKNIVTSANT